ncbi:MAG: PqqD family protein [Merdibacter sp.]|nr:PqqD family protein [Merdibacter sp.]
MKISKEFILREIAGEYILVPVGKTALTFNGLVTVNEVGALIWGMLEKGSDVSTIVNGILDEYDVDEQTATADVLEFISYLKSNNIIDD